YRLPSSIRCLLDSAELLVLPATGRTVDFHHTITRALPGALKKEHPAESGMLSKELSRPPMLCARAAVLHNRCQGAN
ncbi:hypothetical protein LI117_11575, partial [Sutterella wadsworthensis]|uniref:hypothetical protein n=1 Tax=Sutterella wadsworthensis TaxID=40545 RepID=UPI001D083F67